MARGEPWLTDQGRRVAGQRPERLMEMQPDGQLGAFFHMLHGGRHGDSQIEFTAPGVDIAQWFGVAGESQYAPTKAALDGLARSRAIEIAVAFLLGPSGCAITDQRLGICAGASL